MAKEIENDPEYIKDMIEWMEEKKNKENSKRPFNSYYDIEEEDEEEDVIRGQ